MKYLAVGLIFLCWSCGHAVAVEPSQLAAIERRADPHVSLDLTFQNERGVPVTLRQLGAGKPILLVPVLHRCPNICAITLADLIQAIGLQHYRLGTDFNVVAFGIDPREKPADAADSLEQLQRAFPGINRSGIHALTGASAAITMVTNELGYRYSWDKDVKQYAHIAAIAVLTPDGRLTRWLYGLAPDPKDLRLALTEAGRGEIGGWVDQLQLLCFHLDPRNGRYDSAVGLSLRIAGGLSVALLVLLLVTLIRQDRRKAGR